MVAHTLATEAQFRNWLATTAYSSSWTGDAATIRRLLEQSTRDIEAYCGNSGTFGPWTATIDWDEGDGPLYADPRPVNWDGTRNSMSRFPWLISVTSATLYNGTDRASSDALVEGTDYLLTPYSPLPLGLDAPYTGMKYKDTGSNNDPWQTGTGQKVLAIAAEWGWQNKKTDDTTLDGAITSTSAKTFDVVSSTNLSAGMTILVDSERMYIESISSNTLTVERGAAGTTAATHLTGVTVSFYYYPAAVTQCCLDLTRLAWVDRTGGLQDEITVGGNTISTPQNEKRAVLHDIDSYATHSYNQGVTF